MTNTTKAITYLLLAGLIFAIITVFFEQRQMDLQIENPGFNSKRLFRFIGCFFLICAGLLALFFESKEYPFYSKILYVILVIWIAWVYFRDGKVISTTNFFELKSLSPFLALSIMFATSNKERLQKVNTVFFYGAIALSINLVINISRMGFSFNQLEAWMKLRELTNGALWIIIILLFSNSTNSNRRNIVLICFGLVVIASLLMATRSNLIICFIVLLLVLKNRNVFKNIDNFYLILLLIIPLILLFSIFLESEYRTILDHGIELLQGRMDKDTRTTQISEFVHQLNYDDLVTGAGTSSTWYWDFTQYQYLDNQWLLTAWWAGLLPTVCYLLLLAVPMVKAMISKKEDVFVNGLMLFFWILACAGLAIFVAIGNILPFYAVSLSTGIATYNFNHENKITFDKTIHT